MLGLLAAWWGRYLAWNCLGDVCIDLVSLWFWILFPLDLGKSFLRVPFSMVNIGMLMEAI